MKVTKELHISGLADKDMRAAIGAVCVHWSLLELMVEYTIADLEGRIARVVYTEDITRRLEVLKTLAWAKLPAEQAQYIAETSGYIKTISEDRHRAVHGLWAMDTEAGNIVSIYPRAKRDDHAKPYVIDDLRETKRKIWDAYLRLRRFADARQPSAPP